MPSRDDIPTTAHPPGHHDEDRVQLRRLQLASAVEATTLLLLALVAVPLKHLGGWPAAVQVMGPVHGIAFVAYLLLALQAVAGGHWTRADAARLLLLALLPFGGYLNAAFLSRVLDRTGGRA